VSDSCSHVFIQNCIGSIKEIYSYFKSSSKRTLRLIEVINNSTKKKLAKVCDTRWIDRHECVITFRELYPFVIECFQSIVEEETGKDRTIAFNCLKNIQSSSFIVSLCVLKKCLSVTLPIAAGLQTPDNDIMNCKELIDDALFIFKQMRNERLDEAFHEILDDIKELCDFTGIVIIIVKRVESLTIK
jgi:hypothetical protein